MPEPASRIDGDVLEESTKALKESPISDQSIYDELMRRSGGQLTGDQDTIDRFTPIYQSLHSTAQQISEAYRHISAFYGLDPGKIDLVLGGGRAKGKPFKADSDLDLFFYIQNPVASVDSIPYAKYGSNAGSALDESNEKKFALLAAVNRICEARKLPNEFHIMGFGDAIRPEYRENDELIIAKLE